MRAALVIMVLWLPSPPGSEEDWRAPMVEAARLDGLVLLEEQIRDTAIGDDLTLNDLIRSPVDLVPRLKKIASFAEPDWSRPGICSVLVSVRGEDVPGLLEGLDDFDSVLGQTLQHKTVREKIKQHTYTAQGAIYIPPGINPDLPDWVGPPLIATGWYRPDQGTPAVARSIALAEAKIALGRQLDQLQIPEMIMKSYSTGDQQSCTVRMCNFLDSEIKETRYVSKEGGSLQAIIELDTCVLFEKLSNCALK